MQIKDERHGIYIIRNLSTGSVYVGQTVHSFRVRCNRHRAELVNGIHANQRLQRAWSKYGKDSFQFEIVEIVDDASLITAREQYWLDHFRGRGDVYNLAETASSPRLGVKNNPSHTQKSADAQRGIRRPHEIVERMKATFKDRWERITHPRLGKKHTAESIEKMRLAHSGKRQSDETKAKRSTALKGRERPQEVREKISKSSIGKKGTLGHLGHRHSAETRQKISDAKKREKDE